MDFGDFEGRTADEMICDMAYREWVDGNCEGQCPNGEDKTTFQVRVQTAFDFVVRDAIERQLNKLAVVGHGGTIMSIMSKFAKSDQTLYDCMCQIAAGMKSLLTRRMGTGAAICRIQIF